MRVIKRMILIPIAVLFSLLICGYSSSMAPDQNDTGPNDNDIEVGFSCSRVLIVIDKETSLQFIDYTANDFPDVDCVKVTDLTVDLGKVIKERIEQGADPDSISYNTILSLELKDTGKENIIEAISKLQQLDFVLSAEPDFVNSVNPKGGIG